ncbi:DUF7275 domain-containing protein [Nocardia cyriacigeorgica]|uniref:DUF7275 domain-containing protein n=1 Tax=Nocardia cyriacigeorgica TaxID=135487 RepID=UPI002455EE98|nr:hypothetical protein [Nocardia cyriacigeorgica]
MAAHGIATREPKDLDLFTDQPGAGEDSHWHELMGSWWLPGENRVASVDELYTIKLSHSYWELRNGSWDKHMSDLVTLQDHGAKVIQPLHDLLYRVWEQQHGRKKVNLTEEADEFFSDAVIRRYDHDSLHESVAYGDRPIYEEVLKDGKTVQMDMRKIWAMPHERQIQLFREEVYVTALERKVIPSDYTCSPRAAYAWALRRTITSLTKGRSAQFMSENYRTFRVPDMDYVKHHLSKADRLKPLEVAK